MISTFLCLLHHGEIAGIEIAFKGIAVELYCFLFGFARNGVPHIVLIHSVNDNDGLFVFDFCRGYTVANAISTSRRRCEDRGCRLHAVSTLNVCKVLYGVILLGKAEDLITFLIESVESRIPNAGDTALIHVQTNRETVGSVHSGLLTAYLFRIVYHLLNEGVSVQSFGVNQFAVHNTTLGKRLTNGNRVNIVETVVFLLGVEPVLFDKLCNTALYLCPGHFMVNVRSGYGDVQRLRYIAAVLLGEPRRSITLTSMVSHIANHGPFACDVAVPILESFINLCLRDLTRYNGGLCCSFRGICRGFCNAYRLVFRFLGYFLVCT